MTMKRPTSSAFPSHYMYQQFNGIFGRTELLLSVTVNIWGSPTYPKNNNVHGVTIKVHIKCVESLRNGV